jgi:signal recognition particle receptor subunit beta
VLQLRDGKKASAACVPSQRENRSTYKGPEGDTAAASAASNAGIVVVDTPGHPRLAAVRAQHLESAKGVILCLDSTDMASIKAVAEHLFEVFTSKDVASGGVKRILVASNKSELIFSKKVEVLLKALTDELKTIRKSNPEQAAECPGMGVDGDALDIKTILGADTSVEMVETSAKTGDLAAVHVFIKEVIAA